MTAKFSAFGRQSKPIRKKGTPHEEGTITQDQMDRLASFSNGCEVYESEEYLEAVTVKEEPVSEEEVPSDIPLECLLCAKKLHTVSGLKAHVITHHNYKSVKRKSGDCPSPDKSASKRQKHVCTTCGRSFFTTTDLKVHEVCHYMMCCYVCNAKFNTFKEVSRHRRWCQYMNIGAGATIKPKTLTDILNERKALMQVESPQSELPAVHKQIRVKCLKCADNFPDVVSYKAHKALHHGVKDALDNINKKIEIQIDNIPKQEENVDDQTHADIQEHDTLAIDNKGDSVVKQENNLDDNIDVKNKEDCSLKQDKNDDEVVNDSEKDIVIEQVTNLDDTTNVRNEETTVDKQEKNVVDQTNQESDIVAKQKETVDYARIVTELESIFDIAVEKRVINVTILENETSDSNEDVESKEKNEGQRKTIEDILKSPCSSQDLQIDATTIPIHKEHTNEQVVFNEISKEVSDTDSSVPIELKTEINVLNDREGTSNLSNKPSEEPESDSSFPNQPETYTDGQSCEDLNNKGLTAESLNEVNDDDSKGTTDVVKEIIKDNSIPQHDYCKNGETNDPMDIEAIRINHTKTPEKQDKENEKPELNGDAELLSDKIDNSDENKMKTS